MSKAKKSYLPEKSAAKTVPWLWANDKFEEKYPALYELLAAGLYEGEPRKPATLTLYVLDGRLKAVLSDKHTGQALWLTLEPFDDVLAEVELRLTDGKEAWKAGDRKSNNPVF